MEYIGASIAVPFVEQTARQNHSRSIYHNQPRDGDGVPEVRPPHRFAPGVCSCGTVLSTYNPHILCASCRTKALRADPCMEFKDRRPREQVQAVSSEYGELHSGVDGDEEGGGGDGVRAGENGGVPEGV